MIRSAVFALWMFGAAVLFGVACLPLLLGPRKPAMTPIRLWAKATLAGLEVIVGLRVEIEGLDLAPTGPALVAAKHQSMLDVLVALAIFPDPCIVLKKELMWIPFFGWFAAKSRMITIDRASGAKAVRHMTHAAATAIKEGRQVFVFPEGTRRHPGAPPAYKPGVAGLYRALETRCTPMATNAGLLWPAKGLAKYPGVAVFEILPPIPEGLKRPAFMTCLETEIEAACSRLLREACRSSCVLTKAFGVDLTSRG
jgi:1-acyl-sn-glycerol-3-phosphate acyltransferase